MKLPRFLSESRPRGLILLAGALALAVVTGRTFLEQRQPLPIVRGPGVTDVRALSDYLPSLKDTPGDTEVYILEGSAPGATVLVLGGLHANEQAGHVAAIVLVENVRMEAGRLIVIPSANASGFSATDPQEAAPWKFAVQTPNGERWFRSGARGSAAVDQWPDPDIYLHYPSGQTLSGAQTRNMNRSFPGRADGSFTERCAYAVTQIVLREKVDLVIDLHEASPEYPVINTIVAHERAMPVAVSAAMGMELRGFKIGLEASPPNLRGLTHRELGDHTPTLAVLMETANPAEGRIRGRTNADLIIHGRDKMYVRAGKAGRLFVPFDEDGYPLHGRVARHLAGIDELMKAFTDDHPDQPMIAADFPSPESIATDGLGAFLK